jgi:hypothetical protein
LWPTSSKALRRLPRRSIGIGATVWTPGVSGKFGALAWERIDMSMPGMSIP